MKETRNYLGDAGEHGSEVALGTKLNPLNWNGGHLIALIVAATIGLMSGEIIGFVLTSPDEQFGLWVFWYGFNSFGGFIGSIVGAFIGVVVVFGAGLLRK